MVLGGVADDAVADGVHPDDVLSARLAALHAEDALLHGRVHPAALPLRALRTVDVVPQRVCHSVRILQNDQGMCSGLIHTGRARTTQANGPVDVNGSVHTAPSNIRGFALEFALAYPVWIGPLTQRTVIWLDSVFFPDDSFKPSNNAVIFLKLYRFFFFLIVQEDTIGTFVLLNIPGKSEVFMNKIHAKHKNASVA